MKVNPKTGTVAKPTAKPKPPRPGQPTGVGGKVAFANTGKVKTVTPVDAK